MPELPDVTVYIEALERRIIGATLLRIELVSPFVLRTVDPPIDSVSRASCVGVRRLGKRIVLELDPAHDARLATHDSRRTPPDSRRPSPVFVVIHLMIAGRFQWDAKIARPLARFVFDTGTLVLTEAGSKRRASMHLVRGEEGLREFDRGGLEVLAATPVQFAERLRSESHTVKRALADPRLFSGIGNAYSDEILHAAKLSPMVLTSRMTDEQVARLFQATRATLQDWTERLRQENGEGFPKKVTAFRAEMAVHGKFGQPCPVCGTPVQRIRYAENETNYCARCQTDGKLLRDRALSRLLHDDWPKSIDEL